jgi:hypothetical protein
MENQGLNLEIKKKDKYCQKYTLKERTKDKNMTLFYRAPLPAKNKPKK